MKKKPRKAGGLLSLERNYQSMKILIVAAEFSPHAKTGGLADATAGLSHALSRKGHDVRVLLPRYRNVPIKGAKPWLDTTRPSLVRLLELRRCDDEPTIYLNYTPELSDIEEIYAGDDRDALRFLSLCDAASALPAIIDWQPDVIHCHDWHAALVPLALWAHPSSKLIETPTMLTLHNIGYQGVFETSVFGKYGYTRMLQALPETFRATDTCNFLRIGLMTADEITTVSPTYAREIQTSQYGMGLEDLIQKRRRSLTGILNGVDYSTWDPRNDPYIEHNYDCPDANHKFLVKTELCAHVGLESSRDTPVIGVVSRLADQKGIDLIVAALPDLLKETKAHFVILGSGDSSLAAKIRDVAERFPLRVSFTEGYDEALAHKIIAGSDMFVIPSRYEPCGLTQLYSLRYGTVPIVRATGGLADTIHQFDPASGTGNGCVFLDADVEGVKWAVHTAIRWFSQTRDWQVLMRNAMSADYSWTARVGEYEVLYRRLMGL